MKIIKILIRVFFIISLLLFGISFFFRKSLPNPDQLLNVINQIPIQKEITMEPFQITKHDFVAKITPLYSYELYGLVVTHYDADTWYDYYHKKDPFNTKDLCVEWGSNIDTEVYLKGKYKSGEFTCYWNFNTTEDYLNFEENGIANNHLIPSNEELAKLIKKTGIGDQVSLKGYLVSYQIFDPEGQIISARGTSTTREDTGDNSCEVVYVTDFEILKKNSNILSITYHYSQYALLMTAFLVLLSIFLY